MSNISIHSLKYKYNNEHMKYFTVSQYLTYLDTVLSQHSIEILYKIYLLLELSQEHLLWVHKHSDIIYKRMCVKDYILKSCVSKLVIELHIQNDYEDTTLYDEYTLQTCIDNNNYVTVWFYLDEKNLNMQQIRQWIYEETDYQICLGEKSEKSLKKEYPKGENPILAHISSQSDLGRSTYDEVVYYDETGEECHSFAGSSTFQDGEHVLYWDSSSLMYNPITQYIRGYKPLDTLAILYSQITNDTYYKGYYTESSSLLLFLSVLQDGLNRYLGGSIDDLTQHVLQYPTYYILTLDMIQQSDEVFPMSIREIKKRGGRGYCSCQWNNDEGWIDIIFYMKDGEF